MTKDEAALYAPKSPAKKSNTAKRSGRKKNKDKPKRPLSAYNFFFKEEREKILKLLAGDKEVPNEESSDDHISEAALNKLRKDGGKDGAVNTSPKFEELGKLIGQRWKALPPDRLTKFSELASEDTERYKKEMQAYNGRQEAKMRDEALKPNPQFDAQDIKANPALMGGRPGLQGYDMSQMNPAFAAAQSGAAATLGYGGYPMESFNYPGMSMPSSMYNYSSYPGMAGGAGGVPAGMTNALQGMAGGAMQGGGMGLQQEAMQQQIMQQQAMQQQAMQQQVMQQQAGQPGGDAQAAAMYGMMGAGNGLVGYGAAGSPYPGGLDPTQMYSAYGAGQNWNGQQ